MALNAHPCWKLGQGQTMSTTFIKLEDKTINISTFPSSARLRKVQEKPIELWSKQGLL